MMHSNGQETERASVRVAAVLAAMVALTSLVPSGVSADGNQVFFRGGFAGMTSNRGGEVFTDVGGAGGLRNDGSTGYYIGAGLDLVMTHDLWGMLEKVAALGEVGVEFKRFSAKRVTSATNVLTGLGTPTAETQVTMLTVDIAPKIKFMEGSRFRPWIIPVGLDFHVISPPSNQVSYLDVGVQFGAGADYQIWKDLKVGMDGRFHLASGQTNTVNNFGTVGAYVGIGF